MNKGSFEKLQILSYDEMFKNIIFIITNLKSRINFLYIINNHRHNNYMKKTFFPHYQFE